jgi:hypothetical protein
MSSENQKRYAAPLWGGGEKQLRYADPMWERACSRSCCPCLCFAFASDLLPLSQRPNAGVAQGAPRQGCRGSRPRPWMADGGGPPEQCLRYGMPSLSEAPNGGAKPFGSFLAFEKGTRRKGETASSRYQKTDIHTNPTTQPPNHPTKNAPISRPGHFRLTPLTQTNPTS